MLETPVGSIGKHFSKVSDPWIDCTKRHKLLDIICISICAVICGADNWVEVENFGHQKLAWLQTFLELPNGIPRKMQKPYLAGIGAVTISFGLTQGYSMSE